MTQRALCIGINDYPGTGSDLAGCVNDAKDWKAALEARGFTATLLLDAQATHAKMVAAIAGLIESSASGDAAVITYSGHGTWAPDDDGDEADGRDEALCPYDVASVGPLLDDELHDLFSSAKRGVHLVFLSDSCHSGTVARIAPALGTEPRGKVRFMPPEIALASQPKRLQAARALGRASSLSRSRKTALTFSGCTDREYGYDASFAGRPNGAFTYVALRTLAKLPASGTYRDWFKSIREQLPSVDYPQTPQLTSTATQRRRTVFG